MGSDGPQILAGGLLTYFYNQIEYHSTEAYRNLLHFDGGSICISQTLISGDSKWLFMCWDDIMVCFFYGFQIWAGPSGARALGHVTQLPL